MSDCPHCTNPCGNKWCPYDTQLHDATQVTENTAMNVKLPLKPVSRLGAIEMLSDILIESESHEDPRDVATRILIALELIGMTPPRVRATFDLKKLDGSIQRSYTYANRWAPDED